MADLLDAASLGSSVDAGVARSIDTQNRGGLRGSDFVAERVAGYKTGTLL
jgi:hypothetical protein